MTKLDLPCGHRVDETASRYIRTDIKNFYTCRQEGHQPIQYIAEPFHWRELVRYNKPKPPEPSSEEVGLRERLKALVKTRMKASRKTSQEAATTS